MSQLKIKIQASDENKRTDKKLTFSSHSRSEARKRLEENTKENEFKLTIRPAIYDELFEQKSASISKNRVDDSTSQLNQDVQVEIARDRDLEHEEENHPSQTYYPLFPGIFPNPLPPDDQWYPDRRDWRKPPEWKEDEELELGPIYDDRNEEKQQNKLLKRSALRSGMGWMKMIAAGFGAVLLGSLCGYLLLMMLLSGGWFREENMEPITHEANNSSGKEVIPAAQVEFDLALKGSDAVSSGSLLVSDRTFYVIQGGVFSEESSGQLALEEMQKQGIPALLFREQNRTAGDISRLLLGISYKRDDALDLAGYLDNQGFEIYIRDYTIPGGTIVIPGTNKMQMQTLNDFFTHGTYLLEKTAAWSGDGVVGEGTINPSDWTKFKETHRQFLEESKEIAQFLPEKQKQWVDQMSTKLTQAVTGMVEYLNQPERSYLLQSQQALLDYFYAYREFLKVSGVSLVMNN